MGTAGRQNPLGAIELRHDARQTLRTPGEFDIVLRISTEGKFAACACHQDIEFG